VDARDPEGAEAPRARAVSHSEVILTEGPLEPTDRVGRPGVDVQGGGSPVGSPGSRAPHGLPLSRREFVRVSSFAAAGTVLCGRAPAAESSPPRRPFLPPFFALCLDTHDEKKRTLPEQAALLKQLGYDGAGHLWLDQVGARLQTLDAVGLKLFQIYLRADLSPGAHPPYDARLKEVLPRLLNRGTMLAVILAGGKPSEASQDPRAVEVVREMAGMAEAAGVKIALYPHAGDWLERVEDAIRVTARVDRPNVGLMFNLCHWLRTDPQRYYRTLLERAMPRLFAVSINGADTFDDQPGWSRYIQPLDRGSFEVGALLRTLRQLGYAGPIGLQCYGLPGDARDHLARSMAAWRKLIAEANAS